MTPANITVVTLEAGSAKRHYRAPVSGSVIYLTTGTYVGSVTLAANGVTLVGRAGIAALIHGDVIVTGSNVTLQRLFIVGNITANGSDFVLRTSVQTAAR